MSPLLATSLGEPNLTSIGFFFAFVSVTMGITYWAARKTKTASEYLTAGGNVNDHGGGTQVVDNGQIDGSQFYSDDLVDMSTASFLSFAHTSSTLTLSFQASGAGWQGGTDEFWGVDSLSISTRGGGNPVPEPATWALVMIAGLAAAATRRQGAR